MFVLIDQGQNMPKSYQLLFNQVLYVLEEMGCMMAMLILYNLVIALHQTNPFQDSSNALVFSPQFASARDKFPSPAHTSTSGTEECVIRGTHQKTGANLSYYHPL